MTFAGRRRALAGMLGLLVALAWARVGEPGRTVVVADGQTTIFAVNDNLLVSGTDSVRVDGRVLERAEYVYDYGAGRVWLLARPGSGAVVVVTYRYLRFAGLAPRLRPIAQRARPDSAGKDVVVARVDTANPGAGLDLSGSKTLGISFGGPDGGGIDQATRVELTGEVEGIRVEAELSDQSSPIPAEGTTRDIQELDKLLISLKGRNWQGSFGDLELGLGAGGFGRVERRAVGALVGGTLGRGGLAAGYATPKGQFARMVLAGIDGTQGPYVLATDGRSATLVPGSEAVYLDGMRLTRGWDEDYTVDYASGELVFTSRHVISSRSRIEATFEYVAGDYERAAITAEAEYRPAGFDLGLGLFRESDDPAQNLALDLSPEQQAILASIGADTSRAWLAGEAYVGRGNGDYVREQGHFVYEPDTGDYRVSFTPVGDGLGSYVYDDTLLAYRYAGEGAGNYAARVRVRLPERDELGYVRAGYGWRALSVRAEGVARRRSLNLFAPGQGAATRGGLQVDAGYFDSSYSLGYRRRMQGAGLGMPGASPDLDFAYRWGGATEGARNTSDELVARARPWQFLDVGAELGRLEDTSRQVLTRVAGRARVSWVRYEGTKAGRVVRQSVALSPKVWLLVPRLEWQAELRPDEHIQARAGGIDVNPEGRLTGGLSARLTDFDAPDSGGSTWRRQSRSRLFQGQANMDMGAAATVEARAAFHDRRYAFQPQDNWDQLLGSLRASVAPRAGLRLLVDLGQSFRRVQLRDELFRYVGPGQGEFRKDTLTGRYVPDPEGDYERVVTATGRYASAREWTASGSGEVSAFEPAALNGSFSLNRVMADTGLLSAGAQYDLRLSVRALEPMVTPVLGASHSSSLDRTLAATGHGTSRHAGYIEVRTDRVPQTELRARLEASRARRTLNSGASDLEDDGIRGELAPVLGERLRLELMLGLERRRVAEPADYPELGRFTLDAWSAGLARSLSLGSRTRLRGSVEVVRRTASVPELPYDLELSQPLGLSPGVGLEFGHSFSDVLSASARFGFADRPDRPPEHRFSSELRAYF